MFTFIGSTGGIILTFAGTKIAKHHGILTGSVGNYGGFKPY